jgi:hypothetical protein
MSDSSVIHVWYLNLVVLLSVCLLSACGGGAGGGVDGDGEDSTGSDGNEVFEHRPVVIEYARQLMPTGCEQISLQQAIPAKLNDDALQDFIVHYWCDLPAAEWGEVVNEPTPDVLIAYVSDSDSGYSPKNMEVFGRDDPGLGGASRKSVRGDVNGDGIDDFAFAMNWEDGRSGGQGNELTVATEPSVLLSGPNYTYEIHRLGQPAWGHAVEMLDNVIGTKDVFFAGFHGAKSQAFRYQNGLWIDVTAQYPTEMQGVVGWANTFRALPPPTPGGAVEKIVGYYDDGVGSGVALFTKSSGSWSRTDEFVFPIDFEIDYITYSEDLSTTNVLTLDGQQLVGGAIDETCIASALDTESPPIVVAKLSAEMYSLGDVVQGETYDQDDFVPVQRFSFFEIAEGGLVLRASPIVNEEFRINANFYDCTDINNDGYTDLVVQGYSRSHEGREEGGLPTIYMNDQRGLLINVDRNDFPRYPEGNSASGYLHDINGDEMPDLVLFPDAINEFSTESDIHIHFANKVLTNM